MVWNRTLDDGFSLTGGQMDDPHNPWIFHLDADPGCDTAGSYGGTNGVALLPKNDLRGISGVRAVHVFPGDGFDISDHLDRWIGGLAHELGHAFGLPHPPGCDQKVAGLTCPPNAPMWDGYSNYPPTFLLPADKATLAASPFFGPVSVVRQKYGALIKRCTTTV